MGFFSKLFQPSPPNSRSYVLSWLKEQESLLGAPSAVTQRSFVIATVSALVDFLETDTSGDSATDSLLSAYLSNTNKDAVLFELACYWLFRMDLWLFANRPEKRNIGQPIGRNLIRLFIEALPKSNVEGLVNERMAMYGEIYQDGMDIKKIHFHLRQLLALLKTAGTPQGGYSVKQSLVFGGAIEGVCLETQLISWDTGSLARLTETLEEYCDLH